MSNTPVTGFNSIFEPLKDAGLAVRNYRGGTASSVGRSPSSSAESA